MDDGTGGAAFQGEILAALLVLKLQALCSRCLLQTLSADGIQHAATRKMSQTQKRAPARYRDLERLRGASRITCSALHGAASGIAESGSFKDPSA
jgi:hypothetical protein